MPRVHSSCTLLLMFLVFSTEGALYGHGVSRCQFSSPDGHDAVYLEQYYFNKVMIAQYNSTLGKVTGYTMKGHVVAALLNGNREYVTHEKWKTRVCRGNAHRVYSSLLNPVEPYIRLKSGKATSSKHPDMLTCSVYNFYPKQIRVTWLRDGKEATSDVTSTDELSNGNWLYQIHSYLEYTPTPGEKVTCMVEHASFKKPMLKDWDPEPDLRIIKIAGGTVGVVLVVLSVAWLIYKSHLPAQSSFQS
ncbi:DLA class II histocompatibility antigen, DR-1 beta chain-like [Anabas testudineus]|uniref:Ig-like domain-containing protein n=1 Tax=Anabas testudineus TaxID=64144 RepID=A0A3Q1H0I5_ANATE|nr:DLA class II histocompatibility antigen, DR-1 beta chain-like [Anabas testudineus]